MMQKLAFAAVSRNYFNMPVWIAQHQGMFADEGLDVVIELHEGVDEVTNRLRDGRVQLAYGITEHVVLDSEAGGTWKSSAATSTGCRFRWSPQNRSKPSMTFAARRSAYRRSMPAVRRW